MTTSETTEFELHIDDYIEEAYERCGMVSRTGYDLRSAVRSLNLMLAEWANRGLNRWTIRREELPLMPNVGEYPLNPNTVDILNSVVRTPNPQSPQSQHDIQIHRISRDEFLSIPNKLNTGRPVQWYVDRLITPVLKMWPIPDMNYIFVYDRMKRIDDAGKYGNTVEIPYRFYPALVAGLAYYLSMKKAPEKTEMLKIVYEEEFDRAAREDVDRANLSLTPRRDFYDI